MAGGGGIGEGGGQADANAAANFGYFGEDVSLPAIDVTVTSSKGLSGTGSSEGANAIGAAIGAGIANAISGAASGGGSGLGSAAAGGAIGAAIGAGVDGTAGLAGFSGFDGNAAGTGIAGGLGGAGGAIGGALGPLGGVFASMGAWGPYGAGTFAAALAHALESTGVLGQFGINAVTEEIMREILTSPAISSGIMVGLQGSVFTAAQPAALEQASQQVFSRSSQDPNNPLNSPSAQVDPSKVTEFQQAYQVALNEIVVGKTAQMANAFGKTASQWSEYDPSDPFETWEAKTAQTALSAPLAPVAGPSINPDTRSPEQVQQDLMAELIGGPHAVAPGLLSPGLAEQLGINDIGKNVSPLGPNTLQGLADEYENARNAPYSPINFAPEGPAPARGLQVNPDPNTPISLPALEQLFSRMEEPERFQELIDQTRLDRSFEFFDVEDPDIIRGQEETDELIGMDDQSMFDRAFTDVLDVTKQYDAFNALEEANRQAILDIVSQNPAMFTMDWGFQRGVDDPARAAPEVDPTTLFDDPFANITARSPVDRDITQSPLEDISPVDPGRFGINQAAAPDVALHAMVSALDPSAVFGLSPADLEALVSQNPALYDVMQAPMGPELQAAISLNPSIYDLMQSPLGPDLQAAISLNPSLYDLITTPNPPIAVPPDVYNPEPLGPTVFKGRSDDPVTYPTNIRGVPAPDFITAPEERASPGIPASPIGAPAFTQDSPGQKAAPTSITVGGTPSAPDVAGVQSAPNAPVGGLGTLGGIASAMGGLDSSSGGGFIVPDWMTQLSPEIIQQMLQNNALNSLLGPSG